MQPSDHTNERAALAVFLRAQRDVVLAIVDGLDDEQMRRSIVPSGWTPLSLIEHLGDAEDCWASAIRGDGDPPTGCPDDIAEAVAYYRAQAAEMDAILAATPLDAALTGWVPPDVADDITTVREAVLHLIEETARHAGHLDIARELIDGRTGLGPR